MILELMQTPAAALELGPFGSALGGTVVGAILALAAFRGRLDVHAAKFEALEKRLAEQRKEDKESVERTLREIERRFDLQCSNIATETRALREEFGAWTKEARHQLTTGSKDSARREEYLLELVLGIAHKQGVRHRFTDVLAKLSSDALADSPETRGRGND